MRDRLEGFERAERVNGRRTFTKEAIFVGRRLSVQVETMYVQECKGESDVKEDIRSGCNFTTARLKSASESVSRKDRRCKTETFLSF